MPNSLAHETSPYLLQHAENPVDWMPWGPEALEKARREDRPIFLSIGYAACHWCHVMAHESFEDEQTAAMMNANFVSIKVDREERPDLDTIYMNAVIAMTGQGGWPMSVFLTPDGQPFYGGTYFPPVPRHGLPAFRQVLEAAARAWQDDRGELRRTGKTLSEHLAASTHWIVQSGEPVRPNLLEQASQSLLSAYSWQVGGWGRAPLFPQPMLVDFLLARATRGNQPALQAARHTLQAMQQGGMYDVVGGGFHRYSTDSHWLVPHFEKMLYDNAQLSSAYLHAYLVTKDDSFRRTCEETCDFILREMTDPAGGFYSSLDADSEGEEGQFYTWTLKELQAILAPLDLYDFFRQAYDLPAGGNFDGRYVLRRRASDPELAQVMGCTPGELIERLRQANLALRNARASRVRPATDDKVLASWNALALRSFAEAARYLKRPDYLQAAQRNADFLLTALHPADRLLRAWRAGQARHDAFLEDYASLILGLLALYQSDANPRWYTAAETLAEEMHAAFHDPAGGFLDTRADSIPLFTQPKDTQDNATPCGNSLASLALLELAELSGREDWRSMAAEAFGAIQEGMVRQPAAFGLWLQCLDFAVGPVQQVAICGESTDPTVHQMIDTLWSHYRPRLVVAVASQPTQSEGPALLKGRPLLNGLPTAYVCQQFTCRLPVTDPVEFGAQLA